MTQVRQSKNAVTLKRNGLTVECFFGENGKLARKIERYGRQFTEYAYHATLVFPRPFLFSPHDSREAAPSRRSALASRPGPPPFGHCVHFAGTNPGACRPGNGEVNAQPPCDGVSFIAGAAARL